MERRDQTILIAHREEANLYADARSGLFGLAARRPSERIIRVEQYSDPSHVRDHFPQQLQPLGGKLIGEN